MKCKINKLVILALATLTVISSCWATPNWSHNLYRARHRAAFTGKLIYVSVDATWCGWSRKMEDETFTDPVVTRLLNHRFVPVMIDGDENPEFVARYGITGYPTGLILDAEGNVVRVINGYEDAYALRRILWDVLGGRD